MLRKILLVVSCVILSIRLSAQNTLPSTGNVGIGTSSPAYKLSIYGTANDSAAIQLQNTTKKPFFIQHAGSILRLGGVASGNSPVNITDSGMVGIGTSGPRFRLDVQEGSINLGIGANNAFRTGYVSIGNTSLSNLPYISFNAMLTNSDIPTLKQEFTPVYNPGGGLIIMGEAGRSGLHIYQKNYNNGTPPYDLTTFTEVFTIQSNGTVGIGTNVTGVHKLAVEGSIAARKVKILQSGWSDFVFHPDYKLTSLYEIEQFVKTNRHLPEIPSATEIEKEGIDVGEIDKKLLQKIEELTLHMIEMKKEMDQLKQQNLSLQAEIQKVKSK